MAQNLSIEQIKKELITTEFFLNSGIPMGYVAGFPLLQAQSGSVFVTLPYLKYKITGVVDKTLVYPVRYGITLQLPAANVARSIVGFENYENNSAFKDMDFNKPIGYFRHEAIKQYNKTQYRTLLSELMNLYDRLIEALLNRKKQSKDDKSRMSALLRLLLEPSLLPMYKVLNVDFYNEYLLF